MVSGYDKHPPEDEKKGLDLFSFAVAAFIFFACGVAVVVGWMFV